MLATLLTTAALAAPGAQPSAVTPRVRPGVRFGPYHLADFVDGTTCGVVWAHGPLRHLYRVQAPNADGSRIVTADGRIRLTTIGSGSVGACANGQPDDGATVGAGIRVREETHFVFLEHGGTFNPDAVCADPCAPQDFFAAVFGPAATFDLELFSTTYTTRCNGSFFAVTGADGVEHDAGDVSGQRTTC